MDKNIEAKIAQVIYNLNKLYIFHVSFTASESRGHRTEDNFLVLSGPYMKNIIPQ